MAYSGRLGDWYTGLGIQVFFFQLYFNKEDIEVAINDFTMHLIISKWLRIQKCRQEINNETKRLKRKEKTVNKGFHSINYIIDHASICFSFM